MDVVELLAEEREDFVVHDRADDAERRERDERRIKEREVAVRLPRHGIENHRREKREDGEEPEENHIPKVLVGDAHGREASPVNPQGG